MARQRVIKKYFEFLRFSLCPDASRPASTKDMDWQGLFDFGTEQALLGVLFEGIKRMPEGVITDAGLLGTWAVLASKIAEKNKQINAVAHDVYETITKDGLRCSILKGQGNAIMYPNPLSRMPGDVDVWITGKGVEEIVDYSASRFGTSTGIRRHHIEFEKDGAPIEVHFTPITLNTPWYNSRLQKWFERCADLQCSNIVSLPCEAGEIAIPTSNFNLVYQLAHLYHHFFDEGVGMRQMVDYYLVLNNLRDGLKERATEIGKELRHLGLDKFAGAVIWVLQKTLGLKEELCFVEPDARRGKVLLGEILNGGNFGQYDRKYGGLTHQSTARKYFTKARRSLTFVRLYPAEAICEPLFRTWHFFWRLKRK